ncbi:MAG: NitT/TauT family transport system substrate-binding protein [Actinomycetota bacterium]|jgi:NitT/TauT family transport system substrate-binding protein|nr:NitT/TauT family transport system substrate-binding protein [Actinomycetota bacterium]
MRHTPRRRWAALTSVAVVGALALTACSSSSSSSSSSAAPESSAAESSAAPESSAAESPAAAECTTPTPVSLQLQWVAQAQFAGYYAAKELGYYDEQCLDVTILEGGVDIVPQTVLAQGGADFAISWVPKALASIEQGAAITNVAQVFQRSGTLQVSFADKGITTAADFKGKKIGNWGFGNEYEVFAAITKAGLDPAADVELVQQQFDMAALLNGEIDAAEAMTYNEYAQVLEAINPATGALYTPEDFNVVDYNEEGVAMYQDAIWASTERLADPAYQELTQKFVTASLQGWIHCRDNAQECADIVLAAGTKLGASHQLWQMNEVNKLIWPSPAGVGIIDAALWEQTVAVALTTKNLEGATIITGEPPAEAYTNQFAEAANAELTAAGLNTTGDAFAPIAVTLAEGGN